MLDWSKQMDQYEKEGFNNILIFLKSMSDELALCGNNKFTNAFNTLVNELNTKMNENYEKEHFELLSGKGPTNKLKLRLGLVKTLSGVDAFETIPKKDAASYNYVLELLKEFIAASQTLLGEGGEIKINLDGCLKVPDSLTNMRPGIYKIPGNKDKICICLQVTGIYNTYLLITLPKDLGDGLVINLLTYISYEERWIEHNFIDIISKKQLRESFITTLKKSGYQQPLGVPEKELLDYLKELTNRKVVLTPDESMARVGSYIINVSVVNGKYAYDITRQPEDVKLAWSDINASKQIQLIRALKSKLLKRVKKEPQ